MHGRVCQDRSCHRQTGRERRRSTSRHQFGCSWMTTSGVSSSGATHYTWPLAFAWLPHPFPKGRLWSPRVAKRFPRSGNMLLLQPVFDHLLERCPEIGGDFDQGVVVHTRGHEDQIAVRISVVAYESSSRPPAIAARCLAIDHRKTCGLLRARRSSDNRGWLAPGTGPLQ